RCNHFATMAVSAACDGCQTGVSHAVLDLRCRWTRGSVSGKTAMYRAFLFGLLCVAQMATAQAALQLHFVTEDFPPFTYAAAPSNDGQKRAAGPLVEIVEATCERL